MGDENFTTKFELARRSPLDDDAAHVLNDDGRFWTRSPVLDGPTDENSLKAGKNSGCIALVESSSFLRECIQRSLQSAFRLPIIPYPSVGELNLQSRSTYNTKLIVLS